MAIYAAHSHLQVLKHGEFTIENFAKGSQLDIFDRFTVLIPYSSIKISVRVIFDSSNITRAPDLILLDDINIEVDYNELVSGWDYNEDRGLLRICEAIKDAYKKI